jgi:hypothetical protein
MTQPPHGGPEWSPHGRPPPAEDRSSLWIVIGILALLVAVAVAVIVAFAAGSDDASSSSPYAEASPGLPTDAAPTAEAPPGDAVTPSPPSPAEPSALPTEGGPSEAAYVSVASRFVRAARTGDCAAARRLTDDLFKASVADGNLCEGPTRRALRDDDLSDYAITYFATFGAAVQFDEGRTYVSLVATEDGPLVQVLIAY